MTDFTVPVFVAASSDYINARDLGFLGATMPLQAADTATFTSSDGTLSDTDSVITASGSLGGTAAQIDSVEFRTIDISGTSVDVAVIFPANSAEVLIAPVDTGTDELTGGALTLGTYTVGSALGESTFAYPTGGGGGSAPVGVADSYSTAFETELTVSAPVGVLSNDTDTDGDTPTAAIDTPPGNGSVTLNSDGSFTYTPDAGFSGTDSFTYIATDNDGSSAPTQVTIDVGAVTPPASVRLLTYPVSDADLNAALSGFQPDVLPIGSSTRIAEIDSADSILSVGDTVTTQNAPNNPGTLQDAAIEAIEFRTLTLGGTDYEVAILRFSPEAENLVVPLDLVADETADTVLPAGSYDFGGPLAETTFTLVDTVNDAPVAVDDSYSTAFDTTINIPAGTGVLANDSDPENDPLTATVVSGPSNGAVTMSPDGSFTYDPDAGFAGTDSFTYEVSDGPNATQAQVDITVAPQVTPPASVRLLTYPVSDADLNAALSGFQPDVLPIGSSTRIAEIDSADSILSVGDTVTTQNAPNNPGTLQDAAIEAIEFRTLTLGGTDYEVAILRFSPEAENLVVPLDLVADETADTVLPAGSYDFGGPLAETTFTLVDTVNDAPVAVDDSYSTAFDTTINIPAGTGVLANDSDPENDPLTATVVSGPSNGAVTMSPDGSFTYDPDAGFAGTDSFTYEVSDGPNATQAQVDITVAPQVTPPASVRLLTYPVSDADLNAALSGFQPDVLPIGSSTRIAEIDSADSILSVGDTVTTQNAPNNPGTLQDAAIEAIEFRTLTLGGTDYEVAILRFSPEAENLVVPLDLVADETADTVLPAGSYDFGGPLAETTFTLVDTVNDAPVAVDQSFTADENQLVAGKVVANDVDGDTLTFTLAGGGADNAAFTIDASTGELSFLAEPDFESPADADTNGTYDVTVEVGDGTLTDTAAITVTVADVNDAPVAVADAFTTDEDVVLAGASVAGNDSDPDGDTLNYSVVSGVSNGTLSFNPNGSFDYAPDTDFNGADGFTYQVSDGTLSDTATVSLTVDPVNDAPVAAGDSAVTDEESLVTTVDVRANDSDVDGGLLTVTGFDTTGTTGVVTDNGDGTFDYDPAGAFESLGTGDSATDSFAYTVSDGNGGTATATVSVTIDGVNDAPDAVDDGVIAVTEDTPLEIDVLANDSDAEDGTPTIDSFTQGTNGTVSQTAGGLTYAPDLDFTGTDSFAYTVIDSEGATATATVSVEVGGINDAPVAVADAFTTDEDVVLAGASVAGNDSDPDGDTLNYSVVSGVSNGTLSFNPNGSFDYAPDTDFNGADGFTYQVSDGTLSDTATVSLTVDPVNDAPVAAGDSAVTDEESLVTTVDVRANDSDVDGGLLTVTGFDTTGTTGVVTDNGDGTFDYDPAGAFESLGTGDSATDSFAYTVSDGNGGTATATVSVTIDGVNDAPDAVDDGVIAVTEDTPLEIDVLANDSDAEDGTPTIDSFTQGTNGTVSQTAGGLTYAPDLDFTGTDSFAYTVIDSEGATATATVSVEVGGINDAPVAVADAFTTDEDVVLAGASVAGNDSDPDGDTLNYSVVSGVSNGTLSFNPNGSFDYAPDTDFNGADGFTYQVSDGTLSDTATVSLTVDPVNDAPVAAGDSAVTDEESLVTTVDVRANDSDVDGGLLTVTGFDTTGTTGVVTDNGDGTFDYDPAGAFESLGTGDSATDSFAYTVSDGNGGTATATVSVTIDGVNDAPDAVDDGVIAVTEDTPLEIDVLANDSDAEDGTPTIDSFTQGTNGTVSQTAGGLTYAPDLDFTGTDSFAYTVIDSEGATATATVSVEVGGINDAPVAVADAFTTDEDVVLAGASVAGNDSDPDGDTLNYSVVSGVSNGTLSFNPNGSFDYAPDTDFNGADGFTYQVSDGTLSDTATVSLTVDPVNDAPVAAGDSAVTDEESLVTTVDVRANDSDVDGGLLTVTGFDTTGTTGVVTDNGDGTFDYDPAGAFESLGTGDSATDSFAYTVSDGNGGTATATVSVTIDGVNDAPDAVDDGVIAVTEDTPLEIDVLANDSDAEDGTPTIDSFTQGTNGTVSQTAGGLTYAPDLDFTGTDSFAYTVIDSEGATATATVSVEVGGINDAPVAVADAFTTDEDVVLAGASVAGNDSDPDGDTLNYSVVSGVSNGTLSFNPNGSFDYAPDTDFNGADGFTYQVSDGTLSDTATVSLTVDPVNDAPVAAGDSAVTDEESLVTTVDVRANDSDVDGGLLTVTGFDTTGTTGVVTDNGDGTFDYDPAGAFESLGTGDSATDSFAYTVSDGNGGTATATVSVTIDGVNDAPDAVDDGVIAVTEDTPLEIDVLANDSDAEDGTPTIDSFTQGTNGTVSQTAGGLTYAPDLDFTGTDSFAYTVIDSEGATATATVSVEVGGINDAPVAVADAFTTDEDVVLAGASVAGNDSDPDGDTLNYSVVSGVSNGTLSFNPNGSFDYAPDTDFNGADGFTYQVSDGTLSDTATVSLTVDPVNDAPVAAGDSAVTDEESLVTTVDVRANDSDVDGGLLTVTGFDTTGTTGVVTDNGDGTFDYDPAGAFESLGTGDSATDSFAYTVSDGNGGTATATVSVTIDGVNDAPDAVDDGVIAVTEDTPLEIDVLANDSDAEDGTPTIDSFTQGTNGTVSQTAGGLTYAPDLDFTGTDSFAYTVIDSEGATATATVSVEVGGINDAPVAVADAFTTDEDVVLAGASVAGNDSDPDGDTLNYSVVSGVSNGTLSFNPNGSFDYAPDTDFNGADGFTYQVSDGTLSDTATVSLTVDPVNDAPVAAGDSAVTDEESLVTTVDVRANDSDVDGGLLTVTGFDTTGTTGVVTDNGDGTFDYDPAGAFESLGTGDSATDSFAYTVSDGNGGTATATVSVTIDGVNDAPDAVDDGVIAVTEDTPLEIDVLANDSDAEDGTPTIDSFTQGANGTVSQTAGGLTYAPDLDFTGTDSFAYTVIDSEGATATATVSVEVGGINDAPVAVADAFTTDEDVVLAGASVAGNDSDPDGDTLNYSVVSGVSNGTLSFNPNGSFDYAPDTDFNGADGFTYQVSDGTLSDTATVSLTVDPVNDAPVAAGDSAVTDEESLVTTVDVRANDSDVDGGLLTVTGFDTTGTTGVVTDNGDGTFDYDPAGAFESLGTGDSATDSFAYTVSDGNGGTATATVSVTIDGVNDAPDAADDGVIAVTEDTPLEIDVLANDSDAEDGTPTIDSFTQGANGTVSQTAGGLTYAPDLDFTGTDSFAYTVIDSEGATATATVSVEVGGINDAPVAVADAFTTDEDVVLAGASVAGNDSDPDGDTLNYSVVSGVSNGTLSFNPNGSFDYAPDTDFNGADGFTYQVSDGTLSDTATVSLTVDPVNDAPVAAGDSAVTDEESLVTTVDVRANDSDVDGGLLTVTGFDTTGTTGVVTDNGDGTFDYDPAGAFESLGTGDSATDSFAYTVSDGNGGTATATVSVTIDGVNDAPDAADDGVIAVTEDTPLEIDVLANDSDAEDGTPTIDSFTQGANGTVSQTAGGLTYAPDLDFTGTDSFAYTVIDSEGATATATVSVEVGGINDAPVAVADAFTTDEDVVLAGASVAGNDSDPDGDTLNYSVVSGVSNGTLSFNPNGSFDYAPDTDFNGADGFTYQVSDGTLSDTATVSLTVDPVNDAPVAAGDSAVTDEESLVTTVDVRANDSDVDGGLLTVTGFDTTGTTGVVTDNGDGTFDYDPAGAFESLGTGDSATDSFAYTVSDGNGGTATATVSVTIDGVNDAPVAADDGVIAVTEDTPLEIDVLANDSDAEDGTPTIDSFTQGANGTVSQTAGGLTYAPDLDFTGTDSFAYTVIDSEGATATATVSVEVGGINDAPVAVADAFTTDEDVVLAGASVAGNDSDPDGDTLNYSVVSGVSNGTLSFNPNGSFDYAPDTDFNGADGFTYQVSDGTLSDTATVSLTVDPVNDAPVAAGDSAVTDEESLVTTVDVRANDSDVDGGLLTVTGFDTTGTTGVVTDNGDGTFDYDPAGAFESLGTGDSATDSFAYTVSDGNGGTATATVSVTIDGVNDAPVAVDDGVIAVTEDTPLEIDVLANDSDAEDGTPTIDSFTQGANGTVSQTAGGLTYAPDLDFTGTDSFAYTVIDSEGATATATVSVEVGRDTDGDGCPNIIDGDFDQDGFVGASDAMIFAAAFGSALGAASYNPDVDMDGDDFIGASDAALFASVFGQFIDDIC